MIYKCDICEKEFKKAGSLALHKYKKHSIGKKEKTPPEPEKNNLGVTDPFERIDTNWIFLGKKHLKIKGTKISIGKQIEVKHKYDVMEINIESGDLR